MKKIERLSNAYWGRPIVPVNISNCGEIFLDKYNGIFALDEGTFIF